METGTAIKKLSLDYFLFLFYRNPDLCRIFSACLNVQSEYSICSVVIPVFFCLSLSELFCPRKIMKYPIL